MLKLTIGNKNYSSWSMRPWVLLKQAGIPFEEIMVRFDALTPGSQFKTTLGALTPVGKVPVLVDGDLVIWDTLAICEYVAELYPDKALWPQDRAARARARSLCAEMHSGFADLRSACPMNIEANLPLVGALVWRDKPAVRSDLARLVDMWQDLLKTHSGPLLMGEFTVVDAYFAPICTRLLTYCLPVPDEITAYARRVCSLPGIQAWISDARAEHDFRDFEEPYRLTP